MRVEVNLFREMKVSSGRGTSLKVKAGVYWNGTLNSYSNIVMNAVPLTVSIVYHMSAWVRVCMCMRVQSQIMVHRWEDYFWESVFPFHLQTPGIRFEWKCFTCWTVLFILKDIFILKITLNYDQRLYTDIFILSECVALMDNALISAIINITP